MTCISDASLLARVTKYTQVVLSNSDICLTGSLNFSDCVLSVILTRADRTLKQDLRNVGLVNDVCDGIGSCASIP